MCFNWGNDSHRVWRPGLKKKSAHHMLHCLIWNWNIFAYFIISGHWEDAGCSYPTAVYRMPSIPWRWCAVSLRRQGINNWGTDLIVLVCSYPSTRTVNASWPHDISEQGLLCFFNSASPTPHHALIRNVVDSSLSTRLRALRYVSAGRSNLSNSIVGITHLPNNCSIIDILCQTMTVKPCKSIWNIYRLLSN